MAKGLRSKTRKYWASERRRLYGAPVEEKQIEEQTQRLKKSLEQQESQASLLNLKNVLNPHATASRGPVVVAEKEVAMEVASEEKESKRKGGARATQPKDKPVSMEVEKESKPKRVSGRASRGKWGRKGKGSGLTLPPKEMLVFK